MLPGSPQEGSGQTPRALSASSGSLDEACLPGFLGHWCVWVGVVGHFVGEWKILWQVGFVNPPAHVNLSLMSHLLSLGGELATSRFLPEDS